MTQEEPAERKAELTGGQSWLVRTAFQEGDVRDPALQGATASNGQLRSARVQGRHGSAWPHLLGEPT